MEDSEKVVGRKVNLGQWFWGTIIVMAVITLGLALVAVLRQTGQETVQQEGDVAPNDAVAPPGEASAEQLFNTLSKAKRVALEKVIAEVEPLLETAYEPVFAAVPAYADFHYSVFGQYAELAAAAMGDMEQKLQDQLFKDLDGRMDDVSTQLTLSFDDHFKQQIDDAVQPSGGTLPLGEVTRAALDDVKARILVTAPISATAAVGTGLAVKSAAKVVAKKIAVKTAGMATAKTGGKWVAAGTGAGSGAALCSWSGPGAALCAAVGGAGAWLVADYGIVKLDEFWSRDDFEADLRAMIDEQKKAHAKILTEALIFRAKESEDDIGLVVQKHDFTMRELSGGTNAEVCAVVADLLARYEPMRGSLAARNPTAVSELRKLAQAQQGKLSIAPLAREIQEGLVDVEAVEMSNLRIRGNLPEEYRANREVSGQIRLSGRTFMFDRTEATETGGFTVHLPISMNLRLDRTLTYTFAVEQHLWRFNKYFGAGGSVSVSDCMPSTGLSQEISCPLLIALDSAAGSVDEVTIAPKIGEQIQLSMTLRGSELDALTAVPNCP